MSYNSQQIIRKILMWFGTIVFIIVFIPYLKEYAFDGPEKEFGTKEGTILCISFVLAVGAKYWQKIAEALANRISKKNDK